VPVIPAQLEATGTALKGGDMSNPIRPPAIIVDMDGTLADCSHRRHFVQGRNRNFNSFYHRCGDDPLHEHIGVIVNSVADHYKVLITTGRPAKYASVTAMWLGQNLIRFDAIFTRADGDYRADDVVKEEILDRDILPHFSPIFALDDRDRVVAMWRRRGIPCLQVAPGAF
jgi:hypothetical protein